MIRLCDALGLAVVAEGIETRAQAETVYDAGCEMAQGHLFAKPVPIGAVVAGTTSTRCELFLGCRCRGTR